MPLTFTTPTVVEAKTANYFRITSIMVDIEKRVLRVNLLRGSQDTTGNVQEDKRFYFETPLTAGNLANLTLDTLEARLFGLAQSLGYVPSGGTVS